MIDYEKLKLAHVLSLRLQYPYYANFIINNGIYEFTINNKELRLQSMKFFITKSIDKFISKLEQLIPHKPPYQVGEKVYYLSEYGHVEYDMIEYIYTEEEKIKYYIDCDNFPAQDQVFSSRESLIDAQILYWTCLKNEEKSTRFDNVSKDHR